MWFYKNKKSVLNNKKENKKPSTLQLICVICRIPQMFLFTKRVTTIIFKTLIMPTINVSIAYTTNIRLASQPKNQTQWRCIKLTSIER